MACTTNSETATIETNEDCGNKGGGTILFYTHKSNIDLDATYAASTDDDNGTIINSFVMNGGATWSTLKPQKKSLKYDLTYTSDSQTYDILVAMIFEGKSAANSKAFCKLINGCGYVMVFYDKNCSNGRVLGIEESGGTFDTSSEELKVVRHLDSSGEVAGSPPRDEIDFGGESDCPSPYLSIERVDFEQTYT